jgi:hypothetical protein
VTACISIDDGRLQGEKAGTVADRDDFGIGIFNVAELLEREISIRHFALEAIGVVQQPCRPFPEARLLGKACIELVLRSLIVVRSIQVAIAQRSPGALDLRG